MIREGVLAPVWPSLPSVHSPLTPGLEKTKGMVLPPDISASLFPTLLSFPSFLSYSAKDQTQGLKHTREALCHRATPPTHPPTSPYISCEVSLPVPLKMAVYLWVFFVNKPVHKLGQASDFCSCICALRFLRDPLPFGFSFLLFSVMPEKLLPPCG